MCIVALGFNCICVSDMVAEFILCMLKDLSIELGLQISLFLVDNIISIIFLEGAYVTNKEICLLRVVFIYV